MEMTNIITLFFIHMHPVSLKCPAYLVTKARDVQKVEKFPSEFSFHNPEWEHKLFSLRNKKIKSKVKLTAVSIKAKIL